MKKRIVSALVTASVLLGMLPGVVAENIAAVMENALRPKTTTAVKSNVRASENSKANLDKQAYNALGFNTDAENDDNSFTGTQNTVLMPKKELYFNYNGSSNYGKMLRKGLNLSNENSGLKAAGAYKLYGQYHAEKWAHLDDGNGYNDGQTGGQIMYKDISSENKHQRRAYAKSVSFNRGSGRESCVATLYLKTSDVHRRNQSLYLEITSFSESGQPTRTDFKIAGNVGKNSAFNERGKIYAFDHASILDITAGDYDGDGRDEIAFYRGDSKVYIYKVNEIGDVNAYLDQTIEIDDFDRWHFGDVLNDQEDASTVSTKRPLSVTLQSFDLNQNNTEELVITASCPNSNVYDGTYFSASEAEYKKASKAYIYGCNQKGEDLERQLAIPLYDDKYILKAANSAAGDFEGNGRKMLVLGGRATDIGCLTQTGAGAQDRIDKEIGYMTVSYNFNKKVYDIDDDIKLVNNNGDDKYDDRLFSASNKFNAPIGMECFNMYGQSAGVYEPTRLFMFDRTYKYNKQSKRFEDNDVKLNFSTGQKNNADESESKSDVWISEIVSGNFTGQDIGRREQMIAVVGVKQSNDDKYWYEIAYISADEKGKANANWEGVINQGDGNYNKENREGSYLTLSAPDVDKDSLLLEFKGSETYYSKPEVQAVMQSPPYFEDVADVFDDYLNNGATGYGKTSANGKGESSSIDSAIGIYTSGEVSFGGAGEIEISVKATISSEHQKNWTKSNEVEYAGGAGSDYVVMYTIPYHRYVYDATDANGVKVPFIIEEPLTPATVIITVDKYDEMASQYNGLEPIRGNILKNEAGDPTSYMSWGKGTFKQIGETQRLTNAGKGVGSTVTVSETIESEEEHTFAVGVEEGFKAGAGVGFFGTESITGIDQSFEYADGDVTSNMEGVAYTGTVDNLPEGVEGFGFNWRLGYATTKLNDEDIIVIGYMTDTVVQPPPAPKNVAITDIAKNSMTIEWDETPEAAIYELYFITPDGVELPLVNIPSTAVENGTISYEVKNLDPATSYTFAVKASDVYGMRSLSSPQVSGTTLSDGNEQFSITKQPEDEETAVGETAVFEISANGASSEPIQYQWYKYDAEDKSWEKTGKNSKKLEFITTDDLNGSKYYCIVYQGTRVLKSKSASLTIGMSASTSELVIEKDGKAVNDNDFVKAKQSYPKTQKGERDVWKNKTVTVDGKIYTELAATETVGEDSQNGGAVTYEYGAPYIWKLAEDTGGVNTIKYYKDSAGAPDLANELTPVIKYNFSEKDNAEEKAVTENNVSTVAAETIDGMNTTTAYKIVDKTDEYIYVCTSSSGEELYYKKIDDNNYKQYTFQFQSDIIAIDSVEYSTNTFVDVKEKHKEEYDYQVTVNEPGEKITLKGTAENTTSKKIDGGDMSFIILDRTTGVANSVAGVYDSSKKQWTAEYTFLSVGIYDITAAYGGSKTYKSSVSDQISVNAYLPDAASLNINGGNMVYDNTFNLNPMLINGKDKKAAENVTYTVKKYENNSWVTKDGLINANIFIPTSIGRYQITATCNNEGTALSATTNINVSAKIVTITPHDAQCNLKQSPEERKGVVRVDVVGANSGHLATINDNIKVESDAFNAISKGNYEINADLNKATKDSFNDKYIFINKRGIFSLKEDTVEVKVSAGANGKAYISYVTQRYNQDNEPDGQSPSLTVDSGTQVPVGADVTFTAAPNPGFGINKWTGYPSTIEDPKKSTSVLIPNISENADLSVSFSYALNSVTFYAVNETGTPVTAEVGTVSGAYAGGNTFNSGDTLPIGTSITLTAKPADGYVLCGWIGDDGEYIKGADGVSNDTSLTYTISNVTSSKNIRAVFAPKQTKTVTFSVLDDKDAAITSADIYVNGEKVTDNRYTTYKHQTLKIEVKAPSSVLIESWSVNGKNVLGKSETYTIYDVTEDTNVVIHCQTPNARTISFSGEKSDNAALNTNHTYITAKRVGGSEIASGSQQPQGIELDFTAYPEDGYRVQKWLLNGNEVLGIDNLKYKFTLDQNSDVKVIFEKKPVITIESDSTLGAVTADVNGRNIANLGYVEFGDNVRFTIVPNEGYVIDKAVLNDSDVELSVGSDNTDTRFYVANNVNADITFKVTYKAKPIITTDCDTAQGSITVNGKADFGEKVIASGDYVDFDSTANVTIKPQKGYVIDTVAVNDTATEFTTSDNTDDAVLAIKNINANQQIKVTFKLKPIISISAVTNGSVTVKGTADFAEKVIASGDYVDFGSKLTVTATPDKGYVIDCIKVNGADNGYTTKENSDVVTADIANVNSDTSIEVSFKSKPVVTLLNDVDKGSVTLNGTADFNEKEVTSGDYVDYDTKLIVEVKPEKGMVVDAVKVDNQEVQFNVPDDSDDISVIVAKVSADTTIEIVYHELGIYTLNYEVINTEDGADGGEHGVFNVKSLRKNMDLYKVEDTDKLNGSISVYEGGEIILDAKGDTGYRVKEWTVDGNIDDQAGSTKTFTAEQVNLMSDKTAKVQFIEGRGRLTFANPENAMLSASVTGADFTSGGSPEIGAVVNFVLTPDEHFVLKHWMLNGQVLENEKELTYDFTADENDATVSAEVQKEKLNITLTVKEGGSAEGLPETVRHGDTVTVTAIAAYGYDFDGWYMDNKKIENADAVYTFVAEKSAEYEAKFKLKDRETVKYSVNNDEWGTITASADGRSFPSGYNPVSSSKIVFVVAPADGYRIKGWSGLPEGSVVASDKLSATITGFDTAVEVVAELEKIPVYQITYADMANGKIVATINGGAVTEAREGTEVTFTAVPDEGWMFKKWTNDASTYTDAEFKLVMTKDVLMGAEFISGMYYDVKYDIQSGTDGGNVSGTADDTLITKGVEVQHHGGSIIKITAVPDSGKMVKEWKVNGAVQSELSNTLTLTLTENVDITVEFEDLTLYDIPADTDDYNLTDIVKTPSDYGAERTVRGRGTAEFKVVPKDGTTITSFDVPKTCGDAVEVIRNNDGTYNVKVIGVKQNITITYSVSEGIPLTIEKAQNGKIKVIDSKNNVLASGSALKAKEYIEIIAEADKGYKLSKMYINGKETKSKIYTVDSKDTAVVVSVEFVKKPSGGSSVGGGGGSLAGATYSVGFETNGGSVISSVKVSANAVLAKPQDPTKDGFTFGGWYTDTELTTEYNFDDKVSQNFTLYAKWNEKAESNCNGGDSCAIAKFTDINLDEWYHEDIEYVFVNGMMKGIEDNLFGPEDSLTRAMLVTVLYRAEGEPEVNKSVPFNDLDMNDYYANAVIWAHQNEIVKGISENEFDPNGNITREQIAAIIYRYAKYKGIAPSDAWAIKLDYADISEISDYAVEAVMYCKLAGIMQGKEDNKFAPLDNATRAEVSAILHRFIVSNKIK